MKIYTHCLALFTLLNITSVFALSLDAQCPDKNEVVKNGHWNIPSNWTGAGQWGSPTVLRELKYSASANTDPRFPARVQCHYKFDEENRFSIMKNIAGDFKATGRAWQPWQGFNGRCPQYPQTLTLQELNLCSWHE